MFVEDQPELILYDSLPFSPSLTANFSGVTRSINTIIVPKALSRAMLFPIIDPGESVGTIIINGANTTRFEYDPNTNGVAPDKIDFEGLAAHEVCHMLGFLSTAAFKDVNNPNDPYDLENRITVFDIFRLEQSSLTNGAIDSGPFSTAVRFLQLDQINKFNWIVTRLSLSSWVYQMGQSLSGNENFGHFREPPFLPGDPPIATFALMLSDTTGFNRNIKTPDVRAMDIIGWNIDTTNWNPGGQGQKTNPTINGATGVSLEPTFQWTTDQFVDTITLLVWQNGQPILNVPELTDLFYVTPPGILDYETEYQWTVMAINSQGANQDEIWTFTTEAEIIEPPACPADINGDGIVDTADIGGLIGSFGNTGTPGTLFGDINMDGIVDTADLGALLAGLGPCPA